MSFPLSVVFSFSSSVKLYTPRRRLRVSMRVDISPAGMDCIFTMRPTMSVIMSFRALSDGVVSTVTASLVDANVGNTFNADRFVTYVLFLVINAKIDIISEYTKHSLRKIY